MLGWIILFGVLAFVAYVRLAPIDPDRWHVPIEAVADKDMAGGAVRIVSGAGLVDVDAAMRALPATAAIAGSVEEGRVTYVTRTRVFGFPDFTTAEQVGEDVRLFARLRFGKSDLGVNRKRLERVIAALKP